ncbi:MAG TPA: sigma-70 family RNA polymerase sigma factor [Bacteroidales bacterium]
MPKKEIEQSGFSGNQVIDEFIENKNNALEKLYKHNYKIVRSYVLKNSGTEADAKDIFQDAMLVCWMNLKEDKFIVKNEFSLSAYLYKIAKYKWLDKLKSKQHKTTVNIPVTDLESEDMDSFELSETQNKLSYLLGLYSRLDTKCKEVLNQFYYEGKRLEEIASELSYDLGSVRTIKYRCMQKLRKMHAESENQINK